VQYLRKNDGSSDIVGEDGRVVARIVPGDAGAEAYAAIDERIAQAVAGETPRVLLTLREGLLEDAQADIECQILLLEDDRFADPKLAIRRRDVVVGEPDSVTKTLEKAVKKGAKTLE
jgi:antitoxin (DNA-binding transcriptional repressor) of toxin-antitoxin stability system